MKGHDELCSLQLLLPPPPLVLLLLLVLVLLLLSTPTLMPMPLMPTSRMPGSLWGARRRSVTDEGLKPEPTGPVPVA